MGVKTPQLLHCRMIDPRNAEIVVDPGDGTEKHGQWHISPHFGVVGATCVHCHVRNDDIDSGVHAVYWLASHYCEAS